MKNKILISGAVLASVAVAGIATTSAANATVSSSGQAGRYGQQQSLEVKAKTLGVSTDELKGKNWKDIAEQKGIDEQKVIDALRASAQERWKTRGLSDDEIRQRSADMEKRQADCDGSGQANGGHGRGSDQGVHRQ